MPKVGSRHFSYDAAGRKAAKQEAKRTGKPLEYNGANRRKTPKKRGVPFHPSDSLVSFSLR